MSIGPKKLVIIDSMLSTDRPARSASARARAARPRILWGSVATADNVPDLTGIDVEVRGLGETSKPQQPLDEAHRKALEGLTRYVLTQAHASSVTFTYPAYAEAPAAGLPKVST